MKHVITAALLAGFLSVSGGASDFDIAISGSERGIEGLSLSLGNYYRVPQSEVVIVERSFPKEELSVVYMLSNRSRRDVRYISDLRQRGLSWWDVSLRLGLDPRTLYVVDSRRHPSFHQVPKHRLKDAEIIERCNVRFLSRYHGISPDDVIDRRHRGEHYHRIHDHYRGRKMASNDRYERHERFEQRDERKEYRKERREEWHDKRGPGERDHGHGRGNDR